MADEVAVIGAGMAGLAAARRLRAAGIAGTLFDKSRGPGGRMATRRVDGLQFDHGAQYVTARGPGFRDLVAGWTAAGQAAEWFDGAFVGTPGMSAPMRTMLDGVTVVAGCPVSAVEPGPGGWTVRTADGPVDHAANGTFAAVVVAVPAPQAVPLVATAGVRFAELAAVRYAPCWALMLAFDAPVPLDCDHLRIDEGDIAWIARNSAKPGRDPGRETIVVHAAPDWSRRHLEWSADRVAAELLARFRDLTGSVEEPGFASAHRWRYALVEAAAGAPCLWDGERRLAACGDWCLGPRVEAAFDSGVAAADAVIAALRPAAPSRW
jgi:renalase